MTLQGELKTLSVPDVVELARQSEDETAAIVLETEKGRWTLFVQTGRVVHAEGPGSRGEAAVQEALLLRKGRFRIEPGQEPPEITIHRPWNAVLLSMLQRLDETADADAPTPHSPQEEKTMTRPRKTREQIADILEELLATSTDIIGAAVVGIEGLIYSARFPLKDMDENLIGAVAAAIYGLSRRNIQQLRQGDFVQALIQGTEGYTLVRSINPQVIFVALLPSEVNLGMAFAEARTVAAQLAEVLQGLR